MEFDQTQNHRCVYKAVTGKGAFDLWVKEWKYTRRKHVENDSFAHEHSLKHAPDSSNRTFCNEAVSITKVPAPRCRLPLFTWHTSSTAFHLAAGHTLTSEYTHRSDLMYPRSLPALAGVQTAPSFTHLLYACPHEHAARRLGDPYIQ